MYIDFSGLFHRSSKDRQAGGRVRIPQDESLWPDSWREIAYKDYPRLPKIALGTAHPSADLFSTIGARRTKRDFARRPLDLATLSTVLNYSCGITESREGGFLRAQPSGGTRYPIEVYPIVFAGTEALRSGLYHFNVKRRALDVLWERPFLKEDAAALFTYPWAHEASLALILSGVFDRNQRKYGERGYRQVLIEAGAIVQNIYLIASGLGVSCCAIDGVREDAIEKLLDVDGITESVIVTLVLG